jgi:hypothetical protein
MMHKFLLASLITAFLGFFFSGCITTSTSYTRVPPGIWRGVLSLEKFSIPTNKKDTIVLLTDQFQEGELPFQFEVVWCSGAVTAAKIDRICLALSLNSDLEGSILPDENQKFIN